MTNKLIELGWTDHFAQHFVESNESSGRVPARVIAEHRTGYQVQTARSECSAHISGRLRHQTDSHAELPAVGDWVAVEAPTGSADVTIHGVLPRKSKFSRKVAGDRTEEQVVAANVDVVWIVSSLDQDFSVRRIERYLALAWESGANPVIVLTKSDLSEDVDRFTGEVESVSIGTPRAHDEQSDTRRAKRSSDLLFRACHGRAARLLGSGQVDASSTRWPGAAVQETAEVRGDGKGRHTTTHRQLLRLPGGGLIIRHAGNARVAALGQPDGRRSYVRRHRRASGWLPVQ